MTGPDQAPEALTVPLAYQTPYTYDVLLDFLAFRAIKGVEIVENGMYARTCVVDDTAGWIAVRNDAENDRILLSISASLTDYNDLLVDKTRRLFDTDCDPDEVEKALSDFFVRVDPRYHIEGIRVPCSFDAFEMSLRAIIGQQITVKAANTLAGRISTEFGTPCDTPFEGLDTCFPDIRVFADEQCIPRLGELGVISRRAQAIHLLAKGILDGSLELGIGADVETNYRKLLDLPGIGPWTANYMLMRAFHYPDGFPAADYGVKLAFPGMKPREIEKLSEAWRPYRSYATMCTWCAH